MKDIFSIEKYEFPYKYKFPGQASDEQVLFVTRENEVMLQVRRAGVVVAALFVLVSGFWFAQLAGGLLGAALAGMIQLLAVVMGVLFTVIGWWWVSVLWQRSIAIVTTKRLTKFIFTTPFNRHSLSLPLDMVVDTGAYTKGFLQAFFKLGVFTARSAAAGTGVASAEEESGAGRRINRKYFYIENIPNAEDLQHYINKVLYAFRQHHDYLPSFRPFIPHLKGDARKEYMKKYPEYWS